MILFLSLFFSTNFCQAQFKTTTEEYNFVNSSFISLKSKQIISVDAVMVLSQSKNPIELPFRNKISITNSVALRNGPCDIIPSTFTLKSTTDYQDLYVDFTTSGLVDILRKPFNSGYSQPAGPSISMQTVNALARINNAGDPVDVQLVLRNSTVAEGYTAIALFTPVAISDVTNLRLYAFNIISNGGS